MTRQFIAVSFDRGYWYQLLELVQLEGLEKLWYDRGALLGIVQIEERIQYCQGRGEQVSLVKAIATGHGSKLGCDLQLEDGRIIVDWASKVC